MGTHKNIMKHGHRFVPAASGGRIPGGAEYPVAVDDEFPRLPAAGDFTVGVIDTGLVLDSAGQPHPWFTDHVDCSDEEQDRVGSGHRERHDPGYLADADGHGTFVAGLILREAPTARILMRGVLDTADDQRVALGAIDDTNVARALNELADPDLGVQVINLSFAGGVFADEPGSLHEAIRAIHDRVAVVAAAGNGGSDTPVWPAAYPEVIAVGALDAHSLIFPEGKPPLANFSNSGDWVDAYAAGVKVLGPYLVEHAESGPDIYGIRAPQHFQGWATWSGTSFASALVSGQIAQRAIENPGMTGAEAAREVLNDAQNIFGNRAVWIQGADGAGLDQLTR
jgi:subtilisin family serine protease